MPKKAILAPSRANMLWECSETYGYRSLVPVRFNLLGLRVGAYAWF